MHHNDKEPAEIGGPKFRLVSLDMIEDPERPLRADLSPESVEDLVISIRQVGIIEPIVVKPKNGRYEVIAGHRRLVAAGIADLAEVPCYILNVDDEQKEFLKIHENMFRVDPTPSDQAEHFAYLIQHHKLSPAKISQLINKSDAYVTDRLNILNYQDELREALDSGAINFSVAREFYRLKDKQKTIEYLEYATKSGLTPALAKRWVEDYLRTLEVARPTSTDVETPTATDTPIESVTTCVYCTKPVKLVEAVITYFHQECHKEVAPN